MARNVVRPVFGQPCGDCEMQVPHGRVRILEADAAAKGHPFLKMNIICCDCQSLRENEERRFRRAERPESIMMIRR